MQHDTLRNALLLMPMAVAVLVALAVPGTPEAPGTADDSEAQRALYAHCRAQSAAVPASATAEPAGPRAQSPAWLAQREAAVTHCLQAALAGTHQAGTHQAGTRQASAR